jgi:hypothetical protein
MLANWIRQTTTTTGTGSLTLSAVSGYPKFSDQFATNQPFYYTIENDSDGSPVEVGIGKLTSATVLARTAVLQTYSGGSLTSSSASAVNLAAGTYRVICAGTMQQGGVTAFPGITSSASLRAMIPYPYAAASNNKVLLADTPRFVVARIDAGKGISALGVSVYTAVGTASDKIRVGIYGVNTDGSPSDLVCESGDMLPNSTGAKSASIVGGKTFIPPGWYYIAMLSNVNANLHAGSTSVFGQVTPLGMSGATAANSNGASAAISSGWTSMPTTISVASLTTLSADFAPLPLIYL